MTPLVERTDKGFRVQSINSKSKEQEAIYSVLQSKSLEENSRPDPSRCTLGLPSSAGRPGMSIAFQSDEVELHKLRERLRQMSDEELIAFGKMVGSLSAPRVGVTPDPWKVQLQEARAEWRRRYPKL